jgi:hypothetical protein
VPLHRCVAVGLLVLFLPSHYVAAFIVTPSKVTCLRIVASKTTQLGVANNLLPPSSGVTSGLIATLAEQALKLRLKGQAYVKFDVVASSSDMLLQGRVGPVRVRGRSWQSPRGLTCRAIEAKVDQCELDISKIMAKRKLLLTTPALGESFIAMNAQDFGNFLIHPLIKPPTVVVTGPSSSSSVTAQPVQFSRDDVVIDPASKNVRFYGKWMSGQWAFDLRRQEECKTDVTVTRMITAESNAEASNNNDEDAIALAQAMTSFFNYLVVELDGTFLAFQDMSITAKGASPSLMLKLGITVHKFPSPGVPF